MNKQRKQDIKDLARKYPDLLLPLQDTFPEAFAKEYHNFGKHTSISSTCGEDYPLYIAHGNASTNLHRGKVLVVSPRYEVEHLINYHMGCDGLMFFKREYY